MQVDFSFQTTDVAILAILVVSGIMAYFRGFVHEVLSIGKWIGTIFITLYGFEPVLAMVAPTIGDSVVSKIAVGLILFLITLTLLFMLTNFVASHVRDSALGPLDSSLGFLYGLLRGAFFVCLAYMLLTMFNPKDKEIKFLQNTTSLPLIKDGADMMMSLVPVESWLPKDKEEEDAAATEKEAAPKPVVKPKDEAGYEEKIRDTLDELIEENDE